MCSSDILLTDKTKPSGEGPHRLALWPLAFIFAGSEFLLGLIFGDDAGDVALARVPCASRLWLQPIAPGRSERAFGPPSDASQSCDNALLDETDCALG